MLTCEDLDGFIERLCDLTRQMDGPERIREAGELLRLIETVPQRFIMEWRAAETADQHYLCGRSLRDMATEEGISFQAMSFWLQNHGPRGYLVLSRAGELPDGDPLITAQVISVDGERTTAKVKQYRAAGRRVVPATFNAVDLSQPDGLAAAADLHLLWQQTGEWESLQRSS